ncbi:hypothetical protein P8452_02635 [Trifolium repens]|nr:hypothetical protein QL285_052515 [Trifolium repens]KAK2444203.1 hypothetical protein QL285_015247 [Trifolium repens]WJX12099.1 hypothetical protein P8452_02635 [Trifolium repens]
MVDDIFSSTTKFNFLIRQCFYLEEYIREKRVSLPLPWDWEWDFFIRINFLEQCLELPRGSLRKQSKGDFLPPNHCYTFPMNVIAFLSSIKISERDCSQSKNIAGLGPIHNSF